jgi:DNA gyrase subunit A
MSDTPLPPDDSAESDAPVPHGGASATELIEDLNIERELQDSYLTYAMSTIVDRALPDVRDGLKPSQRRILVAMNDLNLGPRSKHIKCAKIAGDTSGNYHPHGDGVIYPTLVRMGQPWSMRHPLVDPQGNFGSTDGDAPAAMRYTEARMSGPAAEMLADLKLDTVDYQPNYDERTGMDEPTVLPGKFPNLLVNGSTGIAVGMACNLLPHNLGETCDAIVKVLDEPEVSLADLMQVIPGPDFPTGGIVMGIDGIAEGYATGRGRLTLRARHHVEEHKGRHTIVIDELPWGVIRNTVIQAVAEAAKAGRMDDVSGVNDESGRKHACRLVIDLKKGAEPEVVVNQLWQYTPAQVTVSMINIAIVGKRPRTLGLKGLIEQFILHRREVITRRTRHLLKKAQQRAHLLEGDIFAVCDIDEVVRLIRSSRTREEAIEKLRQRRFRIPADHPYAPQIPPTLLERAQADDGARLTRVQAEAIGRLQLIQLVGLEIEKLTSDYREVVGQIEDYQHILADESAVTDIIREDLMEMKEKYADKRRTFIDPTAYSAASKEMLIAPEDVVVTLSHAGYIKRLPVDTYRAQGRGGRGIKGTTNRDDDFVEHLFVGNTHDHLLFFTNKGRVYSQRVFDLPEGTRTSGGRSVAQLLDFQPGETVARVLALEDLERAEAFLLFATRNGTVKKTAMSAFANIRTNGIIAINLADGDELIGVEQTSGNDEILLGTKKGMAVRFHEDSDRGGVRAMGRVAGGVRGVRLGKGDEVVGLLVVPSDNPETDASDDGEAEAEVTDTTGPMVLVATENGFGKRTPVKQYRRTNRGGKGVKNLKMTPRNGDVVRIVCVEGDEDLMLITQKGIVIRTRVGEIGAYSRAAAGVRIMKLDGGDKLVAMAKVPAGEADGDVTPPPQTPPSPEASP